MWNESRRVVRVRATVSMARIKTDEIVALDSIPSGAVHALAVKVGRRVDELQGATSLGFLAGKALDAQDLVAVAQLLRISMVVTHIDLSNNDFLSVPMDELSEALAAGCAPSLQTLVLDGEPLPLPCVRGVEATDGRLDLKARKLGAASAAVFSPLAAANAHLTALDLGLNNLRSAGAAALAAALAGAGPQGTVRNINLFGNGIGPVGCAALAASLPSTAVASLNLGENGLELELEAGLGALCGALVDCVSLTELKLHRNHLSAAAAELVVRALPGSALVDLDLSVNCLRVGGARVLAGAIGSADCRLTSLALGENNIGIDGAYVLADAVGASARLAQLKLDSTPLPLEELRSASTVSFDGKRLKEESLAVVARLLRANLRLTELDVSKSLVSPNAAAALAAALSASQLRTLRLSGALRAPAGTKAVMEAIPTSQLTSLDVSQSFWNDEAVAALCAALRDPACKLSRINLQRRSGTVDEEMLQAAARDGGVEVEL